MFDGPVRQLPLIIQGHSIMGYCLIGPDEFMYECIFDTGAAYSAIPQKVWKHDFRREDIDKPEYKSVNRVSVFGHSCPAKRVPVQISIMGDVDPTRLLGVGSIEYTEDNLIDFGECYVDFLFDEDAQVLAPVSSKQSQERLKYVYIGLGGGTFRNGGLCINWTKPEAVLVEQMG